VHRGQERSEREQTHRAPTVDARRYSRADVGDGHQRVEQTKGWQLEQARERG
jgi:hypothetical protein